MKKEEKNSATKVFTVLVVDDNLAARNMYRYFLREDPIRTFRVIECADGKSGLHAFQKNQVDCVLLDDELPDMSGTQWILELARENPVGFFPVLFIAGKGNRSVAVQAMRSGAQDYLQKGEFESIDLQLAIQGILDKGKIVRKVQEQQEQLDIKVKELDELNSILLKEIQQKEEAEAAMKKYQNELERSNRDLSDFSHIASHDLKEPLRKVRVFAELVSEKYADALDEKGKDYLARVINAGERMTSLLEGLLEYSRATREEREAVAVNLDEVVHEVLSDLEVRVQETKAHVEVDFLGEVLGNSTQVRQVFQNLLGNSLKYISERPPVIKVSATKNAESQMLEIEIQDNGIGFEQKYADKIFGLFSRLQGRTKFEGSGVGLATCRKIVERLGGSLRAEGMLDQGATFFLSLPLTKTTGADKKQFP